MARVSKLSWHSALQRYYIRIDGKQHYLTKQGGTEDEAKTSFEELKRKLRLAEHELAESPMNTKLAILGQDYLDNNEGNGVSSHNHDRKAIVTRFIQSLGYLTPMTIKSYNIKNWIETEWHDMISAQVGAYKKISAMFNWLIINRGISVNPVKGIKRPEAQPRSVECVLCVEEYRALLTHLDEPYKSICSVLWYTGARPDEILSCEASHYRADRHLIDRKINKNCKKGKLRLIGLRPEAESIIQRQAAKYPTGLLFRSCNGKQVDSSTLGTAMKRAARKSGINKKVMPYGMRHSFASRHYLAGVPVATIASWMDDTIAVVEKHYLHSVHKIEETFHLL